MRTGNPLGAADEGLVAHRLAEGQRTCQHDRIVTPTHGLTGLMQEFVIPGAFEGGLSATPGAQLGGVAGNCFCGAPSTTQGYGPVAGGCMRS
jgi:hypothetical protein